MALAMIHHVLASTELGGAGQIALRLAATLERNGQSCSIWLPGAGPAAAEAARLQLRTLQYTGCAFDSGLVRAAYRNCQLACSLRQHDPGVVHVHSVLQFAALRHAFRLSGMKRVVQVQIDESDEAFQWAFRSPPELIVTCARFLVERIRRVVPECQQRRLTIASVPNAVNFDEFRPANKIEAKLHVGCAVDVPMILMLANLAPHKGQATVIRTVARLKQRGTNVQAWLAGKERTDAGDYSARLEAMIGECGVADRVRLLGHRHDTADLLRAADFLLLPSTHEGLPLCVLEAQATQVPVLAAPTAGIPEVVQNAETGFLLAAADAEGYAAHVQKLLDDPALYRYLAATAFERVRQRHDWSVFSSRMTELYQELLHKVRRPAASSVVGSPSP
jgi:glycosyltransferase involved in cell wall biosynthesis